MEVPFSKPQIRDADVEAVAAALRSGWWGYGPVARELEERFAEYARAEYAVATSTCTAALHIALDALGVGPGDEVITTPLTYISTADAVRYAGAKPVFVDVQFDGNINPGLVEEAVTGRTKAILPVHLYGKPCDMNALSCIAAVHDLLVVEDAAHATEAWYYQKKIGSLGDATCFSFYPTKNVASGSGGMITTHSQSYAEVFRAKRKHGFPESVWECGRGGDLTAVMPGYEYEMTDVHAAIALEQLKRVEENWKRRDAVWCTYDEAFGVKRDEEGIVHGRHLYTIFVEDRDGVRERLARRGIATGINYLPLHTFPVYAGQGLFPVAEFIGEHTLSLPLSPDLTVEQVRYVVDAVREEAELIRK